MLFLTRFLSFLLFGIFISISDVYGLYDVRVVFLKPSNIVGELPLGTIRSEVLKVQDYYRNEMVRKGYGPKTFQLEMEKDGKTVKVHVVNGSMHANQYKDKTWGNVFGDLPKDLKDRKRVHIYFIGGVFSVHGGNKAGIGFPWPGKNFGGGCFIAFDQINNRNREFVKLIAHELGHAFSLYHSDRTRSMMGGRDKDGNYDILDYEARWLDKHRSFNLEHLTDRISPQVQSVFGVKDIGNDMVSVSFSIDSQVELHQIVLLQRSVLSYRFIDSSEDLLISDEGNFIVDVEFKKSKFRSHGNFVCMVIDVHGGFAHKRFKISLDSMTEGSGIN